MKVKGEQQWLGPKQGKYLSYNASPKLSMVSTSNSQEIPVLQTQILLGEGFLFISSFTVSLGYLRVSELTELVFTRMTWTEM